MTGKGNKKIQPSEKEVEKILIHLSNEISGILDKNLIGLYLFGSLTYGDFNPDSSDIDLVAIVDNPMNRLQIDRIKQMHIRAKNLFEKWGDRLECSYTPIDLFKKPLPPEKPRPYYGNGVFYEEAPYGNEWIINNYLLYQHGVSLIGPNFRELFEPVDMIEVQKACIRDLFQEWEPKITEDGWLDNSHYQSYLVMNLCRILYTVMCGSAGTKRAAAAWVKNKFKLAWISRLIEAAENWDYTKEMSLKAETIDFIKFTLHEIKKTHLCQDLINHEFYNAYADDFDKIPFHDVLVPLILKHLPASSCEILEVGSGTGALASWMTKLGHHVTCIEPAEKPANKAKEKGLKVCSTTFQNFPARQKFDSILAISSLIHIPRSEMPFQVEKLRQLLKPGGIAFVSFIEGDDEGYEDPTGKGKNRFFSKFTQNELKIMLSPYFSILEIHKIEVKKMNQSFFLIAMRLFN